MNLFGQIRSFFSLSPPISPAARPLIGHLQKMLTYQQLALEIYNDALASVSGALNQDEVVSRPQVSLPNPAIVSEYLLPALQRKIEIIRSMEDQHNAAEELVGQDLKNLRPPYEDMKSAIHLMLQRAQLQLKGFTSWIANPSDETDTTSLDGPELQAIDQAIMTLNALIFEKVGLTNEEWMEVNRHAFDDVRGAVGLSPLSQAEFHNRYSRGVVGEHVRFFSD